MTAPLSDDGQLASGPLNAEEARAKCEEAAEMIVRLHAPGGHSKWIDSMHLRVFKSDGEPFLTLHIEALQ